MIVIHESSFGLYVIVREGLTNLQCNKPCFWLEHSEFLTIRIYAFFVLNFLLDLRDSIEGLNVEGDCFFFQVNVVEFWCICLVFRSRNPLIGQTLVKQEGGSATPPTKI